MLQRPQGDRDGYDMVFVDAMHKANDVSRICHPCNPKCEAKVIAVDGQYQIGIYTLRPITEGRGGYFDSYGIIREIMQNHLLHIIALFAMETPISLEEEDIRNEMAKVLRSMKPLQLDDAVIGQHKGHHCYFIRLTLEYFKFSSLDSYEFSACKFNNPKHRPYVTLSKNIIAAYTIYGTILMWQLDDFNPLQFNAGYCSEGNTGYTVVLFTKDWNGTNQYGKYIYGWLAKDKDYNSGDPVDRFLSENGVMKAVMNLKNWDLTACRTAVHQGTGHQIYSETRGFGFAFNTSFGKIKVAEYDGLEIPGSRAPEYLAIDERAFDSVRRFSGTKKPIASICYGRLILAATAVGWNSTCTAYLAVKPVLVAAADRWEEADTMAKCLAEGNLFSAAAYDVHPEFISLFVKALRGSVAGSNKRILFLCGDYMEGYEVMAPFQSLQALDFHVDAVCPDKGAGEKCPTAIHDFEDDQTYNEKPGQDFALTASFDSVEALSYDAFVIPGGPAPEYHALTKLKCVMQTWLPASNALLEMMIFHLSYPSKAHKYRVENLYEGSLDDIYATAIRNCDLEGSLMLNISKMISVPDKGRFFAFGSVFSREVATGKRDAYAKNVQSSAIWRGRKQASVENVPYGNTFVMVGLDQLITKNATLTNEKEVDACLIRTMTFSVFPVVRIAVQCRVASDFPKLVEGLKLLAKFESIVLCTMEESDEHIMTGTGELHLEICLKKLLGRRLAAGSSHLLCSSLIAQHLHKISYPKATRLLFCGLPSLHCLSQVLSILLNQKSNFKKHSRNLMPRLTNHGFLIIILEDKYALEGKEMSEPAILEYLKKGRSLKEITFRCVQVQLSLMVRISSYILVGIYGPDWVSVNAS